MRVVVVQLKVAKLEAVNVLHGRVDGQRRERARLARQLLLERVDVVHVDVRVAQCVDELARLEVAYLRDQAAVEPSGRDRCSSAALSSPSSTAGRATRFMTPAYRVSSA